MRRWILAAAPQTDFAVFTFKLDSDDWRARLLERLVSWRVRWLGLPYGDQGLLIHRDALDRVGGYAPLPLMEDVDLGGPSASWWVDPACEPRGHLSGAVAERRSYCRSFLPVQRKSSPYHCS